MLTDSTSSCAMSGTAYPYGDLQPDGQPKTGDSANFGLFKNNWGMMRTYCTQFKGKSESDWNDGAVLNTDDQAAIWCQHDMINALGSLGFYTGQRGVGGTAGGEDYETAVNFIYSYLVDGHTTDDMATYYELHNV